MTNLGRRGLIVLLVATLIVPAGVALADQQEAGSDSLLASVESWVRGVGSWLAGFVTQNHERARGARIESGDGSTSPGRLPSEAGGERAPGDAQQRAGVHLEPGG